ncbi:MAG: NAD(P)-dependent oxidoreductase [Hyphomonadaceae bacterium]
MMTSIDIDMDVYKALSDLRPSEAATINAVLRQMLKLGDAPSAAAASAVAAATAPAAGAQLKANAKPRHAPGGGLKGKVAVIGATGSIGGKIVDEALSRGAEVIAVARDPAKVKAQKGVSAVAGNANDPESLTQALKGADAVLVSVKWADADIAKLLQGIRAAGVKRGVFVVGQGTLLREDGRRQFAHMAEKNGTPVPPTVPAMKVLDALKAANDLEWTAVSCPADIRSGDRTAQFRVGGELMIFDAQGTSRISEQDFAVAILDELQDPHYVRSQLAVAY